MYEAFFHLQETPFSIAPNPHYLYMSQQHNEALAHLVYGVGRDGGFVLLTGEVGTGKTTVCRCFLEQIPDDTDVAFVLNPKLQVEELLATICDELSIPYIGDSISVKDYIDCINGFLLRQHAQGRHTVLIDQPLLRCQRCPGAVTPAGHGSVEQGKTQSRRANSRYGSGTTQYLCPTRRQARPRLYR